jgi:hypothetical protein
MIAQRQESSVQFNALTNAALLAFCSGNRRAVDGLCSNRVLRVGDQQWGHRRHSWQPRVTLGGSACLFQESLSRNALVVYSDKHFI